MAVVGLEWTQPKKGKKRKEKKRKEKKRKEKKRKGRRKEEMKKKEKVVINCEILSIKDSVYISLFFLIFCSQERKKKGELIVLGRVCFRDNTRRTIIIFSFPLGFANT